MHLKDLREYIQALDKIGEVQSIEKSVDLFEEAGGIIRRSYDLRAPAPLFEKLTYRGEEILEGLRVLGAPAAASGQPKLFLARAAISLGLKPTASAKEIVEALYKLLHATPLKPKIVATGPCKENIVLDDDVDIEKLSAPQINTNDGGRYLNTFGFLVAKTIDGKWVNWGIARVMILDKKRCLANVCPNQDTMFIRDQWFAQGKPMPVAIVQGGPPIIPFATGMTFGRNVSECEMIGGYTGKPVELVKCETCDLEVPATAEIVIEGEFSPTEKAIEGPMGEFSGSICLAATNEVPVMHVKAITYRNKGILPVVASGYPIEENHSCWGLAISARIFSDLKAANFPVTGCFIPFESSVHCLVVTVDRDYIWHHKNNGDYSIDQLIEKLKSVLFKVKPGSWMAKIYLMADDIDPSNLTDVFWAFSTRCRPEEHRVYLNQDELMPLMAFMTDEERANLKCPKIIYNCLMPEGMTHEDLPIPAKFEDNWPKNIQERVLKNWSKYGYDETA